MKITPYNNHEGFSCPVTLGPQPENTGSAEAFVLIQSNKESPPEGRPAEIRVDELRP
jgi:hypothetical protein